MKKLIGLIAFFIAPTLSAASGIYFGGLLGYGIYNANPQLSFTIVDDDVSAVIEQHFVGENFIAAPVLGYEWQWDRFRFAAEGQAFWTPVNSENTDDGGATYKIGLQREYVLLARPGYQLFEETPLTLYLNLGAARAQIEGQSSPTGIQALNFGTENVWGYKVGMGFGYDITQHWIARADYIFSQYQNISNTAPQDLDPGLVPFVLDLSSTQSQYLFGLTFKW